eukprot:jgi/Mesen1/6649/ME000340S05807
MAALSKKPACFAAAELASVSGRPWNEARASVGLSAPATALGLTSVPAAPGTSRSRLCTNPWLTPVRSDSTSRVLSGQRSQSSCRAHLLCSAYGLQPSAKCTASDRCAVLHSSTLGGKSADYGTSCAKKKTKNGSRVRAGAADSGEVGGSSWLRQSDPYEVLGVSDDCDAEDIKAAFRLKVKEFHPDVYRGHLDADLIMLRVIRAYELLLDDVQRANYVRIRNADPFEEPEGVAEMVFVNELGCLGRGCAYSCVKKAPATFSFAADTGRARAHSQRADSEHQLHLAVGQCPQTCIHYVTERQLSVLEGIMQSVVDGTSSVQETGMLLDSLISRANYENGRERKPTRKAKSSNQWVDWY